MGAFRPERALRATRLGRTAKFAAVLDQQQVEVMGVGTGNSLFQESLHLAWIGLGRRQAQPSGDTMDVGINGKGRLAQGE